MKTILITTIAFLAFALTCNAQWTTSGTSIVPTSANLGFNVGVGTTSPSAILHTFGVTEQFRVGYNTSKYISFTEDVNGQFSISNTTASVPATGNSVGMSVVPSVAASIANDVVTGMKIAPVFNTSSQTGIVNYGLTVATPAYFTGQTNIVPLRLTESGTNTMVTALQMEATGNYGVGRGLSIDFYGPGTSNSVPYSRIASHSLGVISFYNAVSNAYTEQLRLNNAGRLLVQNGGTFTDAGATIQALSTTEQLRLQYSPSSYLSVTTGPTGNSILSAAGTSPGIALMGGNVGIGTMTPDTKLAVQGTIHSTSVVVDTNVPTPDYVFKSDYNLPTLAEIKAYTDKNHHLPGIPAAAEMEKNGINLGEMNMALLKKVEELTLYLVEKDREDKKKDARLNIQQKQIDELKKILDSMSHKKSK